MLILRIFTLFLDTLQVNTLTSIGIDQLFQKNITDIVNVYLRNLA